MYIGKVSKLTGASPKAIRHYEAIGLLSVPKRIGNYRYYTDTDVKLIRLIKCAQKYGFKLSELYSIFKKSELAKNIPEEDFVVAIVEKQRKLQAEIDELTAQKSGLADLQDQVQTYKCPSN